MAAVILILCYVICFLNNDKVVLILEEKVSDAVIKVSIYYYLVKFVAVAGPFSLHTISLHIVRFDSIINSLSTPGFRINCCVSINWYTLFPPKKMFFFSQSFYAPCHLKNGGKGI